MITLRHEGDIFTANYIAVVRKPETHSVELNNNWFYDLKKVAEQEDIVQPSVSFEIVLVNEMVLTRSYKFKDLSKDKQDEIIDAVQKLQDECGFSNLSDIRQRKVEVAMNQEYEEAARLRDEERKAWDLIEEKNYSKRLKEEIIDGMIIKELMVIAEEKRNFLEKAVNLAKAPIEI